MDPSFEPEFLMNSKHSAKEMVSNIYLVHLTIKARMEKQRGLFKLLKRAYKQTKLKKVNYNKIV